MKKILILGSLLGLLYSCAPSTSPCQVDSECPKNQICENQTCVSYSSGNNCQFDVDCTENEICDYGICVTHPGAIPEATWKGFRQALQQKNLERMIEFCDPSARERCERLFLNEDLTRAAQELVNSNFNLESDRGEVRTYSLSIGDKDYPIIFYKEENNRWMIHGL